MSEKPDASSPIEVHCNAGETVWWCACGKSRQQPFCDGSHKGSEISPIPFTPEQDGPVWFCACKRTANAPQCDGSHKSI